MPSSNFSNKQEIKDYVDSLSFEELLAECKRRNLI